MNTLGHVSRTAGPEPIEFGLNPELDPDCLATQFEQTRRLQIADFLAPAGALQLSEYLMREERWIHVINSSERTYEVPCSDWDALPDAERKPVISAIDETAAYDFQFHYDTIRVPGSTAEREASDTTLDRFALFLSSRPVLEWMQRITGANDLVYADCQATRYRPGDFLSPHSDLLDGMNRSFAYVLSLSSEWLPRWGGLLQFVDRSAGVEKVFTPRFNSLALFEVGQSHFVSQVATYAPVARLSVTGWLRTQIPA